MKMDTVIYCYKEELENIGTFNTCDLDKLSVCHWYYTEEVKREMFDEIVSKYLTEGWKPLSWWRRLLIFIGIYPYVKLQKELIKRNFVKYSVSQLSILQKDNMIVTIIRSN